MLVFFTKLTALEDGEIRTWIVSKLEENLKVSLQMVAEDSEQIGSLRHDMLWIEEINAAKQKQHKYKFARKVNLFYDCG